MPKIVHFGEFLKTWSLWSNSVTRQVSFNRTKIDRKCQNATLWVIFKQCEVVHYVKVYTHLVFLAQELKLLALLNLCIFLLLFHNLLNFSLSSILSLSTKLSNKPLLALIVWNVSNFSVVFLLRSSYTKQHQCVFDTQRWRTRFLFCSYSLWPPPMASNQKMEVKWRLPQTQMQEVFLAIMMGV